jgi:hypothetical protein
MVLRRTGTVPAQDLNKKLDEARAAIDALALALADLRDEGRRAGVPPGWLR